MVVYSSHMHSVLIYNHAPSLAKSYLIGNLVTLDDVVLVHVAVHLSLRVWNSKQMLLGQAQLVSHR